MGTVLEGNLGAGRAGKGAEEGKWLDTVHGGGHGVDVRSVCG